MSKILSKHPVIAGTFMLSITNIITRMIGFFYRIYLSRVFGAEGIGIIQLTGPVGAMIFSVTTAGMQTALSKCISAIPASQSKRQRNYLLLGTSCSLVSSILCGTLIYYYADPIALHFLSEIRTVPILKVLAFHFPLSAAHACINGYYLGKRHTLTPALSQFTEQFLRVSVVYICCTSFLANGDVPDLSFTAWGILIGEAAALSVSILALFLQKELKNEGHRLIPHHIPTPMLRNLLKYSIPISANRLSVNFLQSIEAVRIPLMLQIYGLSNKQALSTYGILSGMAMPVLFFPGAFTGALSTMLLPTISEAHSKNDQRKIRDITINATFTVIFFGLFCGIIFFMFSDFLGTIIFKEPLAGIYIRALCLLCPFMYLNGVLTGILQGLGKVLDVFFINVSGLLLRLIFVFWGIPKYGIKMYLLGLLISQLYSSSMYIWKCYKAK